MVTKQETLRVLENLTTEENKDRAEKYINMVNSMNDSDWEKFLKQLEINTIDDIKREVEKRLSAREISEKPTPLNDLVSYGYIGDTIHIHLVPKDAKFLLSKQGLQSAEVKLIEALEQLQDLVTTDDRFKEIKQIYAVSGLMKRPISPLFSNLGFAVKTMKAEEAKNDSELKKFYDRFKDKKHIGSAILPVQILLSEKWNKLKDERKKELQSQLEGKSTKRVSKEEIQGLEKIGEGKCADIYKKGKQVYKILKEKSDSKKFYSKEMLEKILGIKSDICVFPNEILEDSDGNLLGYSMDFVEGEKFQMAIRSMPFEELQLALQEAEDNIKKISEQGVIFNDMHSDNLMWNEESKKIQIIDTDFFKKTDQPTERNILKFDLAIQNMLYEFIGKYGITENEGLVPFYGISSFTSKNGKRLLPSEYIIEIKKNMERDFGVEFSNLGEVEEKLQQEQEEKEYEAIEEQNRNQGNIRRKPQIVQGIISIGKKLLRSGVEATKKRTRSGAINTQVHNIETIERGKMNIEDDKKRDDD